MLCSNIATWTIHIYTCARAVCCVNAINVKGKVDRSVLHELSHFLHQRWERAMPTVRCWNHTDSLHWPIVKTLLCVRLWDIAAYKTLCTQRIPCSVSMSDYRPNRTAFYIYPSITITPLSCLILYCTSWSISQKSSLFAFGANTQE